MSFFFLSLCPASFHFFAAHLPLCVSLDPTGKFPSLCNSHFASFSCSVLSAWLFPLFLFELLLSRDEKLIFVSPCLRSPPPLTLYINLSIWLPFPFRSLRLLSLPIQIKQKPSQEFFKQNANGLLMDPCLPWCCLTTDNLWTVTGILNKSPNLKVHQAYIGYISVVSVLVSLDYVWPVSFNGMMVWMIWLDYCSTRCFVFTCPLRSAYLYYTTTLHQ